jgi:hypothetical protein
MAKFIKAQPDHQNGIRNKLKKMTPKSRIFEKLSLLKIKIAITNSKTATSKIQIVTLGMTISAQNVL